MEVLTELDSKQRELLMRMYRSRLNEEVFPVSFDMGGVGETLMQCGFIVAVDGFYEFTETGLQEWRVYRGELNAVHKRHQLIYRQKKQAEVEQKKMAKDISLSDWEKQARENLSPKQVEVLRMLYDAGADTVWVEADIHHITRDTLVRYGYIEYDKRNNKYWLLDDGVRKLGQYPNGNSVLPMPHELPSVQPFLDTGLDNEDSPDIALSIEIEVDCDGACDDCVHREVLDLIAQQYPNVGKLRDTYLQQKQLMRELGIKK